MPLPPLQAISTTPAMRLAYVLRHFWQAYEEAPAVSIGYADARAQVEIAAVDHAFFQGTAAYPAEPHWRDWAGRAVPFFFAEGWTEPLVETLPTGQVRVLVDVVSAAFYLLSGWQEYYSSERDQHGRFPYAASVQCRYGFVAVPVVNYYFDVLRTAVEQVTGQPLRSRSWGRESAAWAAFITHDIDNLYSAWKEPAKADLKRGRFLRFGQQLWRHFTEKDAWDNLELVQQTVAGYGAKSTFFFLPEHHKAPNGTSNADYPLTTITRNWARLQTPEVTLGLHGSIGTATDANQLKAETARLELAIRRASQYVDGIRFHYLCWEPRLTPHLLDQAGLAYDTTLGFAEHFGFRHAYCHPFYPFNFQTGEAHDFLEIPLNVMDATLHHPRYLQLAPEEILPALTPMLQEIERFGGACTVLWHNENFDPANQRNGPREFRAIMEYLCRRQVAFVNGSHICRHFSF